MSNSIKLEYMDIHQRIAQRLRELRDAQGRSPNAARSADRPFP
jgi:hypothetical protein